MYFMLDDIATLVLRVPSKRLLITLTPKRKRGEKSLTMRELKEISFPVSFIYFCLYFFSAWKSFHLWGGSEQWIKQWLSVGFKACTTPKLNTCLCIFPKYWAQYLLERYLIATFFKKMNAQFSQWIASQMPWSWWQSGVVSVLVCIVWKTRGYSRPPFPDTVMI